MAADTGMRRAFRWVAVMLFALFAGALIVRSTIVEQSEQASGVWASHPDALSASIMAEVGQAAARGGDPSAQTMARVEQLAAEQPLSQFPFLVHGALAARGGDLERAERLLTQARQRAPRSPAARYMLADLYLRTSRPLPAMQEMAVLNRLVPGTAAQLAPAFAAYAATPGAVGQLKAILSSYPELEPALLVQLAASGGGKDVILALASKASPSPASRAWQSSVLNSMMARKDYGGAYAVWTRFAGAEPRPSSIFNPNFAPIEAPPPFNWELAQGSGGLAESEQGGLQVLYYGREDVTLAGQTLLLEPGRYRLAMSVTRDEGDPQALRWRLTCIGAAQPALDLPLASATTGRRLAGEFVIPPDCAAQRLELHASGKEFAERAGVSIGGLQLTRL